MVSSRENAKWCLALRSVDLRAARIRKWLRKGTRVFLMSGDVVWKASKDSHMESLGLVVCL